MAARHKIAVFASGDGSNFEAIAEACLRGDIDAEVVLMVCDKPSARVCSRAERLGISSFVFTPADYASKADYEHEIAARCEQAGIELICLAGYMRIVGEELLGRYRGRLINIHPALLPAFPGAHAIQDAFDYGVKVYGVTIHYVDEVLDGGRIISQAPVCYEGRDIDELEAMIHKTEHRLYVDTVRKILKEKE